MSSSECYKQRNIRQRKENYLKHGKLGTDSEWISLSNGLVNVLLNVQWSNHQIVPMLNAPLTTIGAFSLLGTVTDVSLLTLHSGVAEVKHHVSLSGPLRVSRALDSPSHGRVLGDSGIQGPFLTKNPLETQEFWLDCVFSMSSCVTQLVKVRFITFTILGV